MEAASGDAWLGRVIVSIAGLSAAPLNLGDLGLKLERASDKTGFSVEAQIGKRMDLCSFTLQDTIPGTLAIPDRAEVIVYDAVANANVVDPPSAISAYNSFKNGLGTEHTDSNPVNWTPRLFAGYCATPKYTVEGPQRYVEVTSQDYTYRLRSTVVNQAFASGGSDQFIIQTLGARYRSDFDYSQVLVVSAAFPAISFPVHTFEQFMERIIKVSRAIYRVDYYKRMSYGLAGQFNAPINFSDVPDFASTFPTEGLMYQPDGSGLVNKVWVIGSTFLSNPQGYVIPPSLVNGTNFQFPLPGDPEPVGMSCTVAGVDQGHVGIAPGDGDVTTPASLKYNVTIQHAPATVTFKAPPGAGVAVIVTGQFRYPLVQSVSDPALIAAANGLIFEGVLRDKRINDFTLARQVGAAYLKNQGQTLKGGTFKSKYRAKPYLYGEVLYGEALYGGSWSGGILQPGQVVTIKNDALFIGLLKDGAGNPTTTGVMVITKLETSLSDDVNQPYETEVSYADRNVSGGY
jgi:hypothetical protein